jgi:hypothetical protein
VAVSNRGVLVHVLDALTRGHPASLTSVAWPPLVALARAHKLDAALAFYISRHPACGAPPDVATDLSRAFTRALAAHVLALTELERVLGALAAASIPVVTLKGAVLAESLYPHPAIRPF